MKYARMTSAVIAAMTAITPLLLSDSFIRTASAVLADETGAVTALPDWIPTDFDSAAEFRNTYGATHIDNGVICIVYPKRANVRGESVNGYSLIPTPDMGEIRKQEVYCNEYSATCFNVFVYQPDKQGDIALKIVDTHTMSDEGDKPVEPRVLDIYSFSVNQERGIAETDIYSWLPDSTTEFSEYVEKNGEVSVKDNYIVFCTVTIEQFGDRWEPDSNNKYECFRYLLSSDCTMEVRDMYVDGSYDRVYVYQAVKDGNETLSWTRTSSARPDPNAPKSYTLTANCAVFDNAQSVLPANTARFSIIDGETGELTEIDETDKIFLNPDIRYSSGEEGVYASVDLAAPQMTSNPYFWDISQFKDADIFKVDLLYNNIPKGYLLDTQSTVVRKFDNGAIDYTFRLKKSVSGDVNDDGKFNAADAVLLQKWLLAVPDAYLANWKAADFNSDNKLNVLDLSLMKHALIQADNVPVAISIKEETGGVVGGLTIYKVYSQDGIYFLHYEDLTFHQDAQPLIVQISEQDYRGIMSLDYDSMILDMKNLSEPDFSEAKYTFEITLADGSNNTVTSDRFPSVLIKLKELHDKYFSYVEPDIRKKDGDKFVVYKDGLKMYLGPDESYASIVALPAGTQLTDLGVMDDKQYYWIFTEYNGQFGWIRRYEDDNITETVYYILYR